MVERKKNVAWEDKIEKKVSELEEKIERIGKNIETKAKTIQKDIHRKGHHGHTLFWGIVLIVVGIIWLSNNLELLIYEIPWIPVVMIAGGIYLIIRNWEKEESTGTKQTTEKKKK